MKEMPSLKQKRQNGGGTYKYPTLAGIPVQAESYLYNTWIAED
jgi:hypothetical protein